MSLFLLSLTRTYTPGTWQHQVWQEEEREQFAIASRQPRSMHPPSPLLDPRLTQRQQQGQMQKQLPSSLVYGTHAPHPNGQRGSPRAHYTRAQSLDPVYAYDMDGFGGMDGFGRPADAYATGPNNWT